MTFPALYDADGIRTGQVIGAVRMLLVNRAGELAGDEEALDGTFSRYEKAASLLQRRAASRFYHANQERLDRIYQSSKAA